MVGRKPAHLHIRFDHAAGVYEMDVQYFDQNNGASKFSIFVGNRRVDEWVADDHLPATKPVAIPPRGAEYPGWSFGRGMKFALRAFQTAKNTPLWTTSTSTLTESRTGKCHWD